MTGAVCDQCQPGFQNLEVENPFGCSARKNSCFLEEGEVEMVEGDRKDERVKEEAMGGGREVEIVGGELRGLVSPTGAVLLPQCNYTSFPI